MVIEETIKRECCQENDKKIYKGFYDEIGSRPKIRFCVWCGQIWIRDEHEFTGVETIILDRKAKIS